MGSILLPPGVSRSPGLFVPEDLSKRVIRQMKGFPTLTANDPWGRFAVKGDDELGMDLTLSDQYREPMPEIEVPWQYRLALAARGGLLRATAVFTLHVIYVLEQSLTDDGKRAYFNRIAREQMYPRLNDADRAGKKGFIVLWYSSTADPWHIGAENSQWREKKPRKGLSEEERIEANWGKVDDFMKERYSVLVDGLRA